MCSIGGGTTWHSAAMCGSVRFTQEETLNSLYGLELYEKFEKEYGIGKIKFQFSSNNIIYATF